MTFALCDLSDKWQAYLRNRRDLPFICAGGAVFLAFIAIFWLVWFSVAALIVGLAVAAKLLRDRPSVVAALNDDPGAISFYDDRIELESPVLKRRAVIERANIASVGRDTSPKPKFAPPPHLLDLGRMTARPTGAIEVQFVDPVQVEVAGIGLKSVPPWASRRRGITILRFAVPETVDLLAKTGAVGWPPPGP